MKRVLILLIAALSLTAIAMYATQPTKVKAQKPSSAKVVKTPVKSTNVSKAKPVQASKAPALKATSTLPTKTYSDSYKRGNVKISVDFQYPTGADTKLVTAIRKWMLQDVVYDANLSLTAPQNWVQHYMNSNKQDAGDGEYGYEASISIKLVYEDSKVVTFMSSHYEYNGGAHGMYFNGGTTFRKADGRILTGADLKWSVLRPLVRKGLKGNMSENDFKSAFFGATESNFPPKPGIAPWITAKGLVIGYSIYEIAPYSSGEPQVVIPRSTAKTGMTPTGITYL